MTQTGGPVCLLSVPPSLCSCVVCAGQDAANLGPTYPAVCVRHHVRGCCEPHSSPCVCVWCCLHSCCVPPLHPSELERHRFLVVAPRPHTTCFVSAHEGVKCFKLVWLGDSNNILTAGFTKQSKREFRIFDTRDLR